MTALKCTGRSAGYLFSETVITDGQWHRIGLVWDGTNRILYVDGIVVAEDTQHGLVGSQMDLFSFHYEAIGMPIFHPNGIIIWESLIKYWKEEHKKEKKIPLKFFKIHQ